MITSDSPDVGRSGLVLWQTFVDNSINSGLTTHEIKIGEG